MKTKMIIISTLVLLMVCFGIADRLDAGEAYNLNGDWDAAIKIINVSGWSLTEKDIVKISQQGNQFIGIKTIGGKFVGKNEDLIKGKLLNRMVEEVFVRYPHDPITFDLS